MWVSASTDYAIRMMICLADAAGPVSSSKLARMIGVSTRYLLQIGARLRDAGMITVTYGSSGGYKLSLPPEEICLLDIIMLMERRAEQTAFHSDEATETEFQLLEQTFDYCSQYVVQYWSSYAIALRFKMKAGIFFEGTASGISFTTINLVLF